MPPEDTTDLPIEKPATPVKNDWGELIRFAIFAVIVATVIKIFIAQPFIVNGASMDPTFHNGQYLIIDRLSYHLREPVRGEVIVFRYPKDKTKYFIKRIIGLPGETVNISSGLVTIKNGEYPDGFKLYEEYINTRGGKDTSYVLGEKDYFVMGDNRTASSDSRSWGSLDEDLIIGRAFLRLFPISSISYLPGFFDSFNNLIEENAN